MCEKGVAAAKCFANCSGGRNGQAEAEAGDRVVVRVCVSVSECVWKGVAATKCFANCSGG